MGHDIHFLERLSRVNQTELELALSLYQDSALVKTVLERARLPDGAERIAVALSERTGGPHVVLARDGGFVTCLGEGMSTGSLPLLSHPQLTKISDHHEILRERMAMVQRFTGGSQSKSHRVIERLLIAGHRLSREEFLANLHFRPLLFGDFKWMLYRFAASLPLAREKICHLNRVHPDHQERLQQFWNQLWALGHLHVLIHSDTDENLDALVLDLSESKVLQSIPSILSEMSLLGPFMRSLWGISRLGKTALRDAKEFAENVFRIPDMTCAVMSLTGMAHRQSKLRAEVVKFLSREHDKFPAGLGKETIELLSGYRKSMVRRSLKTLEESDQSQAEVQASIRTIWGSYASLSKEGDPEEWRDRERVGTDLLMHCFFNHPLLLIQSSSRGIETLAMKALPWMVKQKPEDLYFPEAQVHLVPEFNQSYPLTLLEEYRDRSKSVPKVAEPRQARNELCSCGSGKKFKRCHGA